MKNTLRRCTAIFVLYITVVFAGCSTGKPVETFFLLEGKQLYFIRPSDLDFDEGNLSMDFTYNTTSGKDVICNFSVMSSSISTNDLSDIYFCITEKKDTLKATTIKRLFIDEDMTRYTAFLTPEALKKLIECTSTSDCPYTIHIVMKGKDMLVTPTKSFKKAMQSASKSILWE